MKWKRPQSERWLKGTFGVTGLGQMTHRQATDALTLVLAAQIDDDDRTYGEMLGKLQAGGRVK